MSNVLITGSGKSGSWIIRGEQLGRAIGATITLKPDVIVASKSDVVVCVKRVPDSILQAAARTKATLVWDTVDAWPQPAGNEWDKDLSLHWASSELRRIKPDVVVCASARMADDFAHLGAVTHYVPHHVRPDTVVLPPRDHKALRVGFVGGKNYVARWGQVAAHQCAQRGWTFTVDRGTIASLHNYDIVLGLRDYSGYAATSWKSNVKLTNAHGAGVPFVGSEECGYLEVQCGAEYWCNNKRDLGVAFEWLSEYSVRAEIHKRFLKHATKYSLQKVAEEYKEFLYAL